MRYRAVKDNFDFVGLFGCLANLRNLTTHPKQRHLSDEVR